MVRLGMNSHNSGLEKVEESGEHSNEPSGSRKFR
jgi:hypothetical protein